MICRIQQIAKNLAKKLWCFVACAILFSACQIVPDIRGVSPVPVNLPFMRLEQAGECYYIDDFLPTPDSLVSGKANGIYLRYYTYWNARYKYWSDVGIMLSFYSRDSRCWALFEEYVLPRQDDYATIAGQ